MWRSSSRSPPPSSRAPRGRGVASVKLLGYTPLAASVGTILLMLAIIGFHYVLRPVLA